MQGTTPANVPYTSRQLHSRICYCYRRNICTPRTYPLPPASGLSSGDSLSCTAVKRGGEQSDYDPLASDATIILHLPRAFGLGKLTSKDSCRLTSCRRTEGGGGSLLLAHSFAYPPAHASPSRRLLRSPFTCPSAVQHANPAQPQVAQDTLSRITESAPQPTAPQVSSTGPKKRRGETTVSNQPQTVASAAPSASSSNGNGQKREGGSAENSSTTTTTSSSAAGSGVSGGAGARVVVSATGSAAGSPAAVRIAPDDDLELVVRAAVARIPGMSYGDEHKQLVSHGTAQARAAVQWRCMSGGPTWDGMRVAQWHMLGCSDVWCETATAPCTCVCP